MKLFTLVLLAAVADGKLLNVETQENMTAVLGGNVTFSCTSHLEDILQVTWQKLNGQSEDNIATFSEIFGPNILGSFSGRADFMPSKMQVSTIVLFGVKLEDEGCYQCIFHTFINGQNIGKTCLTVDVKDINAKTQENMTAVLGGNVTFSCTSHLEDILQVTWQKLNGQSEDNIATFSGKLEANFSGSFIGRATSISSKVQVSTIVLSGVKLEDEGCYQCVFYTFRNSKDIGKTCLTVQAHTKSQLHVWIILVLVIILIAIFIFSFYWYKKGRHQQRKG
ncbi:OX-2 membrane glycoprotein isoform X1 [Carcharodon carcharias]|uniref:OX-2 membrane glycoprotein isoform X1 n=1 Tax=Carcharodon carcharias TaxID=13397 RepID=UPI001B7F5B75|nr:OX-2 membrane glycoprotein isoform X1 [Carcharodon carcharias]